MAAPLGERELVERARQDADAFAELYRLYLARIHAFAFRRCGSREVAEDVTAATFEAALRSLPSFRWTGGGFGPWLFRIAANQIVDHHRADERARGRRDARALRAIADLTPLRISGGSGAEESAPAADLLAVLATLNPRYQRAISLRYLAELSHQEAAEAMGTTKAVMAVTLHRALRSLRRALEDNALEDRPERVEERTEVKTP